jgi:hypothetical protein
MRTTDLTTVIGAFRDRVNAPKNESNGTVIVCTTCVLAVKIRIPVAAIIFACI